MKATIDLAPYPNPPVELVSAYWARRSGKQIMPHLPLHTPVHHQSDPPHLNLLDRVRPCFDTRQKQNRLPIFVAVLRAFELPSVASARVRQDAWEYPLRHEVM